MQKEQYPHEAKLCCPNCGGKGFIVVGNKPTFNLRTKEIRNHLRELNDSGRLKDKTLREIGKMVGVARPQQVKHHLLMLEKLGWQNYE